MVLKGTCGPVAPPKAGPLGNAGLGVPGKGETVAPPRLGREPANPSSKPRPGREPGADPGNPGAPPDVPKAGPLGYPVLPYPGVVAIDVG